MDYGTISNRCFVCVFICVFCLGLRLGEGWIEGRGKDFKRGVTWKTPRGANVN